MKKTKCFVLASLMLLAVNASANNNSFLATAKNARGGITAITKAPCAESKHGRIASSAGSDGLVTAFGCAYMEAGNIVHIIWDDGVSITVVPADRFTWYEVAPRKQQSKPRSNGL